MNKFDLGQNANGSRTEMYMDDEFVIIRDVMDVQPILENNARLRGQAQRSKNARHVADIPDPIYYEWQKDWKQNFADKQTWPEYIAAKLNSREWFKLRTHESRI